MFNLANDPVNFWNTQLTKSGGSYHIECLSGDATAMYHPIFTVVPASGPKEKVGTLWKQLIEVVTRCVPAKEERS